MDRLNAAERADTWFGHGERKHHVHISHALIALGGTGRARESQNWALSLSGATTSMAFTLLRIDAAACLHRDGDTEQACRTAAGARRALPPSYSTRLTHERARDLLRSIPVQHHVSQPYENSRHPLHETRPSSGRLMFARRLPPIRAMARAP
ncbi:hypothetical protein ACH4GP_16875 [Streptomyces celluloflavus]|uniref:Uncharacterized protein n=1 Tax=Streptomyces celluloflavus TaxID=58344 RepID=A0ABW7RF06_9ACTN